MLKIGEFSKLCQLPVKTLRYYDEIGLLTPAETDSFSGYRYYSPDQLPRLNRILALKDLGLSLDQIAAMIRPTSAPKRGCPAWPSTTTPSTRKRTLIPKSASGSGGTFPGPIG